MADNQLPIIYTNHINFTERIVPAVKIYFVYCTIKYAKKALYHETKNCVFSN